MSNTGIRPHTWITGPDPVLHAQYLAFLRQRSQAWYRGEGWDLEFLDWVSIWQPVWHLRGRKKGDYQMTRLNWQLPWSMTNVQAQTRANYTCSQTTVKLQKKALLGTQSAG